MDANVFIYYIERNPKYFALSDEVFTWLERPNSLALTSTVTMTELLVMPYREGDQFRIQAFYDLLSIYPHLDWIPVDLAVSDIAARLRAQYRLKTPDSLQAASAVSAGATALITNDRIFERVTEFESIVLDKYL